MTARSRRARTTPRPGWGLLYGIAALVLTALAAVEIVALPGAARTALRCAIALGGFAAMALWARRNRVALDRQDWCECAASSITVRVIQSRRLEPEHVPAGVAEEAEAAAPEPSLARP